MALVVTADGAISESPLTEREREILGFWAHGLPQKEIALKLRLSPQTVKKHIQNIYRKLKAHNKVQALVLAGYL